VIASWRSGAFPALANLVVAQRTAWGRGEWKHASRRAGGIDYELSPSIRVGAEYWARGRLDRARAGVTAGDDPDDPGDRVLHYAGPAVLVQRGRVWLAAGAHVRLDRIARSAPIGDRFGKLWVRALIGLEL
jgi:hypothetical protein